MHLADERQRLGAAQPIEQREILGHDADLALDRHRIGERIHVENPARAARRPQQSGQALDRRGLARAVRPEEAVEAAARNGQIDAVDGDEIAERLAQPGGLDRQALTVHAWTSVAVRVFGARFTRRA